MTTYIVSLTFDTGKYALLRDVSVDAFSPEDACRVILNGLSAEERQQCIDAYAMPAHTIIVQQPLAVA